jgi:hypothetical protein
MGREFQLSANGDYDEIENRTILPMGIGLNLFAGWLTLRHIAFGTAGFSGVLYIGIGDAAKLILKYLASGTVCRLVLYFEIGGMSRLEEERISIRWIVQSEKAQK